MFMETNPLKRVGSLGQSIWLDYIRRDLITGGMLRLLIEDDGLRGMTSNPSIFEKAIAESDVYESDIRTLAAEKKSPKEICDALGIRDVQMASDEFRPVYDRTDGKDGYVSLEVNPHLARDTTGTIAEARRLWREVDRPNIFIKIPATREGLHAIRQSITDGINVNVTLLFGLPRYREVAEAYILGVKDRLAQGQPVTRVASVASFFVSRIDVLVDSLLEKLIAEGGAKAALARRMRGRVAIACAKGTYLVHKEIFGSADFKALSARGARDQRLLWASTSTKNPAYSDVMYVEQLIGPNTINTMPLETLNAYRDHGSPKLRLRRDVPQAQFLLRQLPEMGIGINQVTQQLEDEGIEKFCKPFDKLMKTLVERVSQFGNPS